MEKTGGFKKIHVIVPGLRFSYLHDHKPYEENTRSVNANTERTIG
jgi:hypothetical protein